MALLEVQGIENDDVWIEQHSNEEKKERKAKMKKRSSPTKEEKKKTSPKTVSTYLKGKAYMEELLSHTPEEIDTGKSLKILSTSMFIVFYFY